MLYILANIAYFAGATKQEITTSGQLVAALLFRNVYGPQAERTLDVFIAISSLGGVLSAVRYLACRLADQKLNLSGRSFLKVGSTRHSARKAFYLLASSGHPIGLLILPLQESFYVSSLPFNITLSLGLVLHNRLARIHHHHIYSSSWRRIQLCSQSRTFHSYPSSNSSPPITIHFHRFHIPSPSSTPLFPLASSTSLFGLTTDGRRQTSQSNWQPSFLEQQTSSSLSFLLCPHPQVTSHIRAYRTGRMR